VLFAFQVQLTITNDHLTTSNDH